MRTPFTRAQAKDLIAEGFANVASREATPEELAMLLAHSAHETGDFERMYGNNWGFVITSRDGQRAWFEFNPADPHAYRWYATPSEGLHSWLLELQENWPAAWSLLGSGDPRAYVHALKTQGRRGEYFEADESEYANGVARLYAEFLPPAGAA